jgi:aryl-alcohol dehydrogenase (NADP+)
MQNHYNLAYREEEREMLPLLRDLGVGCIPWSPLARGFLTDDPKSADAGPRRAADKLRQQYYAEESDRAVAAAVAGVASERGVSRASIAFAWLISPHAASGGVTAPIVGPHSVEQVADLAAATELELTPDEVKRLEAPYRPKGVLGHF